MESLMQTEPDDRTGAGSAVGVVADAAGDGGAQAGQVTDGDQGGPSGPFRRRTPVPLLIVVLALATVAFLCAGVFGGWWLSAALSGSTRTAAVRNDALRAGEQAVQNFNTLDYRNVGAGLDLWLRSSTGTLNQQINSGRAAFTTEIQQAKTITTAQVLDGAVTELNENQCKARVIVALQVNITPPTGSPASKQVRIQGDLAGTPGNGGCSTWKLAAIQQVPVGTGSGSGTSTPSAPSGGSATPAPSTTPSGH
jgi:Mce-associated membrane protein